ncbi:hypothetical protein VQ01_13115 [Tamlana sp. s12]|nr:hypothetical protein VQ01_13115 [Tamlana sp. s12]
MFIDTLTVKLNKIHNVRIQPLKTQASFLVDFTIQNPNKQAFNLQTIGLVTLKRILFYEANGILIGAGNVNINSLNIDPDKDLELKNVPFTTNLITGFSKLQAFLKNPENKNVVIELEFEAFNKIYNTKL